MSTTPSMSRTHFVFIAKTIKGLKGRLTNEQVLMIADAFASQLRATNDQFQYSKFIDACVMADKEDTK